jgi:AcrR family transcriptional regulator
VVSTTETGARARTRREIVSAAVGALAKDPGASLADVAAAAQVSRTTVHRYFAERSDLLAAVTADAMEQVLAAMRRAGLDRGPAPDALARLCREYFELNEVLTLLFSGVVELREEDWPCGEEDAGRGLADTVARGQAEGTIDPEITGAWIEHLLWTFLYAAWSFAAERGVPRHEALDLCLLSLRRAITP